MKWRDIIFGWLVLVLFSACSSIDESERFIYVKPASVKRAVLIEEFTGQRCVNCPTAALEIEKLQAQYGEQNIVSVAVHAGPLAVSPSGAVIGLRTSLGDEYYNHFGVDMEPSAVINRRGGVMLMDKWGAAVYNELQTEAPVQLSLSCMLGADNEVHVALDAIATEAIHGKLQLWLTEDSITAIQMMPDGTVNSQYLHQHVLRAAFNGTWGEEVNWRAGETSQQSYSLPVDSQWNQGQLYVIAFVYTDEGVQQVCRQKVSGN